MAKKILFKLKTQKEVSWTRRTTSCYQMTIMSVLKGRRWIAMIKKLLMARMIMMSKRNKRKKMRKVVKRWSRRAKNSKWSALEPKPPLERAALRPPSKRKTSLKMKAQKRQIRRTATKRTKKDRKCRSRMTLLKSNTFSVNRVTRRSNTRERTSSRMNLPRSRSL